MRYAEFNTAFFYGTLDLQSVVGGDREDFFTENILSGLRCLQNHFLVVAGLCFDYDQVNFGVVQYFLIAGYKGTGKQLGCLFSAGGIPVIDTYPVYGFAEGFLDHRHKNPCMDVPCACQRKFECFHSRPPASLFGIA